MADRSGARVPAVLAAGPAGPARDALLVTRPPAGSRLSASPPTSCPETVPLEGAAAADGVQSEAEAKTISNVDATADGAVAAPPTSLVRRSAMSGRGKDRPGSGHLRCRARRRLRAALILRGRDRPWRAFRRDHRGGREDASRARGLPDGLDGGLVDLLDRDTAAALAAMPVVAGPERTVAVALRSSRPRSSSARCPTCSVRPSIPWHRGACEARRPAQALRDQGAAAMEVEVPKLVEPRRVSWVNLALVGGP